MSQQCVRCLSTMFLPARAHDGTMGCTFCADLDTKRFKFDNPKNFGGTIPSLNLNKVECKPANKVVQAIRGG